MKDAETPKKGRETHSERISRLEEVIAVLQQRIQVLEASPPSYPVYPMYPPTWPYPPNQWWPPVTC